MLNEYLVKLHSDSAINRPSYERLKSIKQDFFNAVGKHLDAYTTHDRKVIMSAHFYELAFAALKEKKLFSAFRQFCRAGFRIESLNLLKKRMRDRKYMVKGV